MALLYWPFPEFMNLVLTTSTGDATTVVQKPAPKAAVKWHGRLSVGEHNFPSYFLRQGFIHLDFFFFNDSHLFDSNAHLSSGHTSEWVLWSCHRWPVLHSLQRHSWWCLACNLKERKKHCSKLQMFFMRGHITKAKKQYLSTVPELLRLWQSSYRHPGCRCISSHHQPFAPGLGNAPSPHLLVAQKPQPWLLWCSPPWVG